MKKKYRILTLLLIMAIAVTSMYLPTEPIFAINQKNEEENSLDEISNPLFGLEEVENIPPITSSEIETSIDDNNTGVVDPEIESAVKDENNNDKIESKVESKVEAKIEQPIVEETAEESSESNSRTTQGNYFVFDVLTNTIVTYSSNPLAPKNVTIPSHINGVPVLYIADNAFAGLQLTGLTLSEGLLEIGEAAFFSNNALAGNVTIPSTVTKIGKKAFQDCKQIVSINILANLESIEDYTFSGCTAMTSISLPSTLKRISSFAFADCVSLLSVVIPDSVETIGYNAFQTCYKVHIDVTSRLKNSLSGSPWGIPFRQDAIHWKNARRTGNYYFDGVTGVIEKYYGTETNIIVPLNFTLGGTVYAAKSIGYSAFKDCLTLESVVLQDNIESIGNDAFALCKNLKTISFGNGLVSIGNDAFRQCEKVDNIILPNSLTTIGSAAFVYCYKLAQITIPASVSNIGANAFRSTDNLKVISIPSKPKGGIAGAPWGAGGGALVAWNDIAIVDDFAYYESEGSIVKYFGTSTTVNIPNNLVINAVSKPVYEIGQNAFYQNLNITSISIDNGIKKIGDNAFEKCLNLISIILPSTLTSIGKSSFSGCQKLSSIQLPTNLLSIGSFAFESCYAMVSIVIPESVTTIGSYAFNQCKGLITVDMTSKLKDAINDYPWGALPDTRFYFKGDVDVGDFIFNKDEKAIRKYFGEGSNVMVPSTLSIDSISYPVEKVDSHAFQGNKVITTVSIQEGISSIENYVFENCFMLTTITFPNSVTRIGKAAFKHCQQLASVNLPSNLTSVEEEVFYGAGLTSIVLPNKVTEIKQFAFFSCMKMKSIVIPKSVTTINHLAFTSTNNLEWIDITSKPKGSIHKYNHDNWGNYNGIVLWNEVRIVDDYAFDSTTNTILKYAGSGGNSVIPNEIHMNEIDFPVLNLGKNVFTKTNVTGVTIPDSVTSIPEYAFWEAYDLIYVDIPNSVTSIGQGAFLKCSSLKVVNIPDSVTSIGGLAFSECLSLETVHMSSNIMSIGDNTFYNTPLLNVVYIRNVREDIPEVVSKQPWGANNSVKVFYSGEVPTFDHEIVKVVNQYVRNIEINVYLNAPAKLRLITLPDGTTFNTYSSAWPEEGVYTYPVTANGTYVFKGEDMSGNIVEYPVVINDIGVITVHGYDGTVNVNVAQTMTEQDVLNFVGANAFDELGPLSMSNLSISSTDLAKVNNILDGQSVTIKVLASSNASGVVMEGYKNVTIIGSSCTIDISNNKLRRSQVLTITKEQLKTVLGVTVSFSDGSAANMSKLTISDADLALINSGTVGTCSIWLNYDNGLGRRKFEIHILDDAPSALIQIPQSIEMERVSGTNEFVADTTEEVSIVSTTDLSVFTETFFVRTDPYYTITQNETGETFRVQVYDEHDNIYSNSETNLAVLSGTGDLRKQFKLKAFQKPENGPGIYRGLMNFYLSYGGGGS